MLVRVAPTSERCIAAQFSRPITAATISTPMTPMAAASVGSKRRHRCRR